jgi:sec-independent protein translocase protein TatA
MGLPHGAEWIIILVVALLVFGPKKLPEIGKAVGRTVTEFKKGVSGIQSDIEKAGKAEQEPAKQIVETPAAEKPKETAG